MRKRVWIIVFALMLGCKLPVQAAVYPGQTWTEKPPGEVCMTAAGLQEFSASVGGKGVVIKDGYLVHTWGNISSKSDWASAAKPVISTMLFFALQEGKISSVNQKIGEFDWPLQGKDQNITFHHLANMTSGYMRPESPGQAWAYNDYAIQLYAKTMFDKVFRQTAIQASDSRLADLEFEDGTIIGGSRGGYGVFTSPRDFARLGWLWLNKGKWKDKQLLNSTYFDSFMKAQIPSNLPVTTGSQGSDYLGVGTYGGNTNQTTKGPGVYGYNWWHNPNKITWSSTPEDTSQANGHWNKEVMTIIPSVGMVAAWIGNSGNSTSDFPSMMNTHLGKLMAAVNSNCQPNLTLTSTIKPSPTLTSTPTNWKAILMEWLMGTWDKNGDGKVNSLDWVKSL